MLGLWTNRMKYIKTGNIYLCIFTHGMAMTITGPCLLDLQHMVHTDFQHISMIYAARCIGGLLGSIIIGVILDLIKLKQSVLIVCTFFIAIAMFGIPWCRNVETLLAIMLFNTFFLGALDTGTNVNCLELWGKDCSPVLQGLLFAYSIGGFIAPLIAAPFLKNFSQLSEYTDNTTFLKNSSIANYASNTTATLKDISSVFFPFSIIGLIALLVTILCLAACIISPTEKKRTKDDLKLEISERGFLFQFFLYIFTFLISVFVCTSEVGYGQALTTFAVKGNLHLTTTRGSYITSAYFAALTLSRLAGVYLSIKISSLKLIICDVCIMAVASLMLVFLIIHESVLWILSVIFGAGIAPVYGLIIGWMNNQKRMSSKFASIFVVGSSVGHMVGPFIIAYFIDTMPEMFSIVTAASVILIAITLFVLNCMLKKEKKIYKSKNCSTTVTVEEGH